FTNFKVPYTESKWYLVREIPASTNIFTIINQNQNTWRIGLLIFVLLLLVIYAIMHLFDFIVRDRKRLKSELVGSIDTTTDGICVVDKDYTYTQFNNAYKVWMKHLMGVEVEEGLHLLSQLPENIAIKRKRNFEQAFKGHFLIDEQIFVGRRYRHYFNPILNEEKEVGSVAVRIADVTDRLKNEEELGNYRANLEQIITERTAELRQMVEKVKETRLKLIENEKNATLGLLSAGLSDELTNPVNFVVGNITPLKKGVDELYYLVKLLQRSDFPDAASQLKAVHEYLQEVQPEVLIPEINTLVEGIELGAARVSEIVMNFHEFVRPDQQARFESINRSIELAIEFLGPQIPAEIRLIPDLDDDLPSTFCDIGKINDAFLTVIDHAIRLTSNGDLYISTESDKEGWISATIYGDGLKIDEANSQSLLDSFNDPAEAVKANGIGLTLSKKIFEAHGGTLTIEPLTGQPGNGLVVRLPILIKSSYSVIEGSQVTLP
ncbi:MAG: ATP-binding protein, partial [Bacteroidota bacterium]